MARKERKKNTENDKLLSSGKILPEVRQKMVKGEGVDVIIGKEDFLYVDPKTKKEVDVEVLKKKNLDPKKNRKPVDIQDIKAELEKILKKKGFEGVKIESTDYFISAKLPPEVIREIAGEVSGKDGVKGINRIWSNKKTRGCLDVSNKTIKSTAAQNVFGIKGEGIAWAVLDTGISLKNKHIKDAVIEHRDFTGEGEGDGNGHGTHVAGIIASRSEKYPGIAPKAQLYDFKVLDSDGGGSDFAVISAMEEIRNINDNMGEIVIHGANVSLGSMPVVGSYGVGSSPVCQEANRLVNSGVIVCVAAGNDGHKTLAAFESSTKVGYFTTFMDLTIIDPANAENVITVGSVHKSNPHTYGISFFSAKGPTGDGRCKPDVVAPGEKIKSLGIGEEDPEEDGVVMSGTSMATPHVSGALALFLCANGEFIGQPLKVKEILMQSCTDLKRDRYFQGSGLIDVLRTIQAV
jgi:subtilisin family serine protease